MNEEMLTVLIEIRDELRKMNDRADNTVKRYNKDVTTTISEVMSSMPDIMKNIHMGGKRP